MNIKRWLQKKKQEPVEPPTPPTRAVITTELFLKWGKQPFVHDGLVGHACLQTYYFYSDGAIDIKEDNKTIVHIFVPYFADHSKKCRTTIYDAAYSDRLDGYIAALTDAIQARDDAEKEKDRRELTQF